MVGSWLCVRIAINLVLGYELASFIELRGGSRSWHSNSAACWHVKLPSTHLRVPGFLPLYPTAASLFCASQGTRKRRHQQAYPFAVYCMCRLTSCRQAK